MSRRSIGWKAAMLSPVLSLAWSGCNETDSPPRSGTGGGGGRAVAEYDGGAGWGDGDAAIDADAAPVPGGFALHVVDVGGGLGVFVEGPDFALVYDAGTDYDVIEGRPHRFLEYVTTFRPDLKRIDHVILSHPHQDHVAELADVIAKYDVGDVWDSGALAPWCSYKAFLLAVESKNATTTYHSALRGEGTYDVPLTRDNQPCSDMREVHTAIANDAGAARLRHGASVSPGLTVRLGTQASMKFLYVHGADETDANVNSLVVRIDVGNKRFLLPGDVSDTLTPRDAGGGPPAELELLKLPAEELASDVLVAPYHGWTGAKSGFIAKVHPKISVISTYPALAPIPDVVNALAATGTVFRTDADDMTCASDLDKIGTKNDGRLVGCSNVRVSIENEDVVARYVKTAN